ncbi:MAG: peptidylprolyl isomerase [Nitrospirota bacterium]
MQKKIVLNIILLAVFLTLAAGSYAAVLLDRVVATVNDEVITWSELMSVISIEGRAFLKDVPESQKKTRMKELERPFLKNMVEMKLQLQEAKKMGISVGDTEIDSAISEIKNKYNMTDETLKRSLDAEGITMKDYRKRLSEQIIVTKVINNAIKSNIVITDREIEEYYEANVERYSGDEKVRIRQILFTLPGDGMRDALEQKAKDITGRIKKGEEFSRLAVEFSDGPSREFGGDLGYIGRGSALKEIEDVAFALEIGEVSEPFWSPAGLHIIMIEDRIERGIEKVRDKIQETLFQDSFKMKFHEWSTGLREKASVEIKL